MWRKGNKRNKFANSIVEYSIVIGLVSLAFTTMHIYMKRGLQGKIRDMTDNFIGGEQETETIPTAVTVSETNAGSFGQLTEEGFAGGGTRISPPAGAGWTEHTAIDSNTTVEVEKEDYKPDVTPAEEGDVVIPAPEENENPNAGPV
jgi:hypothetical protein